MKVRGEEKFKTREDYSWVIDLKRSLGQLGSEHVSLGQDGLVVRVKKKRRSWR